MSGRGIIVVANSLGSVLYRGKPCHQIISSASLAILAFFYVYSAASQLNLRIYPLIDRVTYYTNFQVFVISEYVDHILLGSLLLVWIAFALPRSKARDYGLIAFGIALVIVAALASDPGLDVVALVSLPAVAVIFACDGYLNLRAREKKTNGKRILKHPDYELLLNHMAVVGIILGGVTLVLAAIPITIGKDVPITHVRMYAYDISLVLSSYSPVLILLLVTSVPIKILINSLGHFLKPQREANVEDHDKGLGQRFQKKVIILSLIVLLSITLVLIPHLPTVNKDESQIGTDSGAYVIWINELDNSRDLQDFLHKAFVEQINGDRPLSTISLFAIYKITNANPFLIVEYSPLILAPSLVIVTYFLTRQLTSNDYTPLIASFLTAISFHILIGVYAGYYANWIALILGYLSFVFLFRFLDDKRYRNLLLFGTLTLLLLFSHVYTWSILAMAGGIFLIVILAKSKGMREKRSSALLLLLALSSTIAIDIVRMEVLQASGGIDRDLRVARVFLDPEQFVSRWNNLTYTATTYLGGLFANFIMLGLGIYWLVKFDAKKLSSIFIMICLSIGMLPFLIGEHTIQARVFYDLPFELPAAFALTQILQQTRRSLKPIPIYLWLIAAAIIAASNFYLISPAS